MDALDPSRSPHASLAAIRNARLGAALPKSSLVGFLVAIVAVIAISLFSFSALQARSDNAHRVARTLSVVGHLHALGSLIKEAESSERGYLLTAKEPYLAPFATARIGIARELEEARHLLAGDVEQVQRLQVTERLLGERLAELDRAIQLRRAGRTAEALEIVGADHGRELMERTRAALDDLIGHEQTKLEAQNREWVRSSETAAWVTWSGSSLLLVLIVMAAALSSRDFRAQAVQNWLRTGVNELGANLRGELDARRLGDRAASFLARYLDAPAAALHFVNATGALARVGNFGLAQSGGEKVAEGLTREAFEENRVLHVRDVPEGFFEVQSGVGRGKARELVVAPVTADGDPNGVVELGFFRPVTEHELELLKRAGEVVGMALRSAEYRRTQQNLLEETQRYAEELQTQQEELRVSNEELAQQTQALQQSQERLTNQQAELEEINAQLEAQTESLERQKQHLVSAQAELTRASAYKSEFLANMSHELRTPLNSSLILAKLLVDNREGNLTAEQVKFAQTIYSAGNDLLTLINDILDLSRIEAGKLEVRPENVALVRLTEELSNTFEPIARDKSLTFGIELERGLPDAIVTDPTRLTQILRNLLSNALKFTERGGVSLVVRRARDGRLAFEVKDSGIGIPPDQQSIIFDPFRQADGTTNRKYGGTGLGLSISRDLSRLLGGELSVDSTPGQGSTFTLSLPEAYSAPPGGQQPRAVVPAPAKPGTPPSPLAEPTFPDDRETLAPGARSILVIEDDAPFARILFDLAHELDFAGLVAHTGEQGLALATQFRPSAILLDIGLPDRSGLSVLDSLKRSPTTRHIPVHVLSASDYTQAALEMGALGYAMKPVARENLIQAFRRLEEKFTQKLRRVLVVEDNAVHRESTCSLLSADDVETRGVATAAEALQELSTTKFDCVVLDLTLPDRSGFELLAEMTDNAESPPPVIVYTGRTLSRDEEQSLRRFSSSIVIKGARSPERLLDEVTLFLHQVEADLPPDRQRMLKSARKRDAVFEGRRLLLVEDDVRNIFALTSVFEPLGAKVEIARNGREALEHLRTQPGVDLVLMDVMMPEMDGLEATRRIRSDPRTKKLPIIALTAKAMADDRENCLAAGANDYIAKPLDIDKLLSLSRVWMPK